MASLTIGKKLLRLFTELWFLWSAAVLLNIITLLYLYFKVHPGKNPLTLRYNIIVGVEWFSTGTNLYFVPLIGFFITATNFILYRALKDDENFLSFLNVFVSIAVQIILLVAVIFLGAIKT